MSSITRKPNILVSSDHNQTLSMRLQQFRNSNEFTDYKIQIETSDGYKNELSVHKNVVASGCNFFKQSFKNNLTELILNFSTESIARCFEALLDFLYTGLLDISKNDANQLMQIAKFYQIHDAEELLKPCSTNSLLAIPTQFPQMFLPLHHTPSLDPLLNQSLMANPNSLFSNAAFRLGSSTSLESQMQLAHLTSQRMQSNQFFSSSICPNILPHFSPFNYSASTIPFLQIPSLCSGANNRKKKRISNQQQDDSDSSTNNNDMHDDDHYDNKGDMIVPSNDREGWCRNKKYIERVQNGFRCTVCRKVYGRYNSVSYHVTIYHRNPPIKCDEQGCQFSTREARYIHFHKFYRHRIPLPDTIDLGSRKCIFCRHISKSPAMLEKHISRHLPDCSRTGSVLICPQCEKQIVTQKEMLQHLLTHVVTTTKTCLQCKHCSYRGQSEKSLRQHVQFKHSADLFSRKISCTFCKYACTEIKKLRLHCERMHPDQVHEKDDNQEMTDKTSSPYDSNIDEDDSMEEDDEGVEEEDEEEKDHRKIEPENLSKINEMKTITDIEDEIC